MLLFAASAFSINWIREHFMRGVAVAGISEEELNLRKLSNFEHHIDYKFEYLFCTMTACLIFKIV